MDSLEKLVLVAYNLWLAIVISYLFYWGYGSVIKQLFIERDISLLVIWCGALLTICWYVCYTAVKEKSYPNNLFASILFGVSAAILYCAYVEGLRFYEYNILMISFLSFDILGIFSRRLFRLIEKQRSKIPEGMRQD